MSQPWACTGFNNFGSAIFILLDILSTCCMYHSLSQTPIIYILKCWRETKMQITMAVNIHGKYCAVKFLRHSVKWKRKMWVIVKKSKVMNEYFTLSLWNLNGVRRNVVRRGKHWKLSLLSLNTSAGPDKLVKETREEITQLWCQRSMALIMHANIWERLQWANCCWKILEAVEQFLLQGL